MSRPSAAARWAAWPLTIARVVLGGLWIAEALIKFRAGFGAADMLLVVDSVTGNSRTPVPMKWFAADVIEPLAGLFGVLIPWLEAGLGVLLILGLGTVLVLAGALGTLLMYWSSDQLTPSYPLMAALGALLLLFTHAADRIGLDGLLRRRHAPEVG